MQPKTNISFYMSSYSQPYLTFYDKSYKMDHTVENLIYQILVK